MAGHVVKNASGTWEMRVYMGRDPLTRKKQWETRTVEARTKKEAQLACDQFALEVRRTKLDGRSITVGELLERWYDHGVSRDLWSPATEVLHRRKIDGHLAALADRPLCDLDSIDIDEFYDALRARGGPNKTRGSRRRRSEWQLPNRSQCAPITAENYRPPVPSVKR